MHNTTHPRQLLRQTRLPATFIAKFTTPEAASLLAAFTARHGAAGGGAGGSGALRSISRSAASDRPVYDFEDISSISNVQNGDSGDVTAVVTSIGPQVTHEAPSGDKAQKKVITLEDHSASINLTLWREAAALDFPLDEIVTITNAKVASSGLWSTSKTTYAINPATAPPALVAWNAARKAAKAGDGEAAASAHGPRTDSEQ